ncbi:hypothetical protein PV08_08568 [Exophiala spinifera]|uniref:DUF1254 domain-containing protein n=1 Tax=Exophiala spinifera TaxID=91928 RepID=A0A0D2B3X0_9EURO|nr:uncharacterized protein PV08_08568 [Exophiala spinifera]KIW13380.1 hypothetical protein PV08_08568 [Exophiala spinifera]
MLVCGPQTMWQPTAAVGTRRLRPANLSTGRDLTRKSTTTSYGYPLFAYGRFARKQGSAINVLYHERDVIKPGWTKVVRPNNDTMYSSIFCDLSQSDLVISVPEIGDRFWSFSFFDMYGNNYSSVMGLMGHKPGDYRLTFAEDDFGLHEDSSDGDERGVIHSPTPYGIWTVRLLLKNQTDDVQHVHALQNQIKVVTKPRVHDSGVPPFDLSIFSEVAGSEQSPVSEAEQVLRLTAALSRYNQSEVLQDRSWIAYVLEKAGIRDGVFTQPPNTSLAVAVDLANLSAKALKLTAGIVRDQGHGWYTNTPMICGNFRSFYAARYLVAMRGYLGVASDQAIYPSYRPPGSAAEIPDIKIGPKQAIKLSFSRKPLLHPLGFWSLSLYDKDQLFIPNALEHYALGDRNDLKCLDGTPLKEQADGKFEILIQPSDVVPPEEWHSNWLPAPPGGGEVSFTFRVFGASCSMIDGSYEYPKVIFSDALTA